MEYQQDALYRMANGNSQKMPFYMTYPMQNIFLEEAEYERDMEQMKNLYPKEVREIQGYVEEECDKLEYEGSMMFDEYPDSLRLRQIRDRIYQRSMKPKNFEAEQYEAIEMEELRLVGSRKPSNRPGGPQYRPPGTNADQGLLNMIEVLLYQEIYQRRCRHKRCRRWW